VAFGTTWNSVFYICLYMDIIFGLEIFLNFITSFEDQETS